MKKEQIEIFSIVNDLPHFYSDEGKVIVDTGSPYSYSRTKRICQNGKVFVTNQDFPEKLEKFIPENVVALIGMDIIKNYDLIINTKTKEVRLTNEDIDECSDSLDIITESVLPVISVIVNGQKVKLIFDTGAHIPYIHSSLVRLVNSSGNVKDFMLGLDIFESKLYELETVIGQNIKKVKFGVLPKIAEMGCLDSLNVDGVVGINLFACDQLVYSARRKKFFCI